MTVPSPSLAAVDLAALGVPGPHFLHLAAVDPANLSLVGEAVFHGDYPAIRDRGGRANVAESLHLFWNAAHLIGKEAGVHALRVEGDLHVRQGTRPIRADRPVQISARVTNVQDLGNGAFRGTYEAVISDQSGRMLERITTGFWASRHQHA